MTPPTASTSLIAELRWRGLVHDLTEGAEAHLAEAPRTVYVGFDPTGPSLHVGSLLPIMGLVHAQRAGHRPIALVGGGTGLIGDPSGKTTERRLLTKEQVAANAEAIYGQLEHFLDFRAKTNPARLLNNLEWLGGLGLIDFLRDVGKHFSVNQMLAKESVKRRLEGEDSGISFTEFSYALLQSYDFLELYRREKCTVQMGGSDQWGNITAGIDLIRRKTGREAYGFTWPLVTTSSGEKFGKSAGNAIWLDATLTSPYQFYQYFVRAEDADVERYLKFFTFLPVERIAEVMRAHARDPGARTAQRLLAREVTRIVHGEPAAEEAERSSAALFRSGDAAEKIRALGDSVPTRAVARAQWADGPVSVVNLVAQAGVVSSRSEARRLIEQRGLSINERVVPSVDHRVGLEEFIDGVLLVRTGKSRYTRIVLTP